MPTRTPPRRHGWLRLRNPALSGVLDAGKGVAQRAQAHDAQAERLGVEVLEAEGGSGPRPGFFPGLEPDPLAELVGRGLPGPAEEAVQLKAQPLLFPAGVGPQELPRDLGVPPLALPPAGALGDLQLQVFPDVQGRYRGAPQLSVEHPEAWPRVVQVAELAHEPFSVLRPA